MISVLPDKIEMIDTMAKVMKAQHCTIRANLKRAYPLNRIKKAATMLPQFNFEILEGVGVTKVHGKHSVIIIHIDQKKNK